MVSALGFVLFDLAHPSDCRFLHCTALGGGYDDSRRLSCLGGAGALRRDSKTHAETRRGGMSAVRIAFRTAARRQ